MTLWGLHNQRLVDRVGYARRTTKPNAMMNGFTGVRFLGVFRDGGGDVHVGP
jgi:hypothetical protein